MPRAFTDASVSDVLISIEDRYGRKASLSFEPDQIVLNRHRPYQGRTARITYDQLLDLALQAFPDFFAIPKSRRRR
jgi:hypothetical protein